MTGKPTGVRKYRQSNMYPSKFGVWQVVSKSLTLTRELTGSGALEVPATVHLAAGNDSIQFQNTAQRSWEQMVCRVFNGTLIMSEN